MKTVIVGGVAGGMSCATRLRRLNEQAEIIVLEQGEHVSFANCGLPYYAGGVIKERQALLLETPESLKAKFNLDIRVQTKVTKINPEAKTVEIENLQESTTEIINYDNLVLSQGATPFLPPIDGIERALTLRNVYDVDKMKEAIDLAKTKRAKAVVMGAGFIGLELVENLANAGFDVTLIELAPQVLPPLDKDMAFYVEEELRRNNVDVRLGISAQIIEDDHIVLSTGERIESDIVIASVGVRPEVDLANNAGIEIGERGGVVVNEKLQTNIENIYAIGDMVEKQDEVLGGATLIALANIANKQGRLLADILSNVEVKRDPTQAKGTAVVQVFDLSIAMTGASQRRLKDSSKDFVSIHTHPAQHTTYYPGSKTMHLVLHFNNVTGEIYGAQGVGPGEVVRRIDVLSTAMAGSIKADELLDLELAYSPQHGSAKDPINILGYIAHGVITDKARPLNAVDVDDYLRDNEAILLDVRSKGEYDKGHVENAVLIIMDELRDRMGELSKKSIVLCCQAGQRGHSAARLLEQNGFNTANIDGGYITWCAYNSISI